MAWGSPGHRVRHFDGRPFHRFHHDGSAFFFGLGVGALVTAPFWYAPAYPYPMYAYPSYPPPAVQPPVYWYYCQKPAGYYPYVPQCPGRWLTVGPPAGAP